MTFIIHIIATMLGIAGALLLAAKKPVACQLTWVVGNICWIAWCVIQRDALTGLTFATYLALSLWGVYNWRKGKHNA